MINKNKIILMTKLAIYDKKYGVKDKRALEYYKKDYVYANNVLNRFYAFLGAVILLLFYLTQKILIGDTNLLELNYTNILIGSCIFVIVVMCLHTAIGTIRSVSYYNRANKRMHKYISGLRLLLSYESSSSVEDENLKEGLTYGPVTTFERKKY